MKKNKIYIAVISLSLLTSFYPNVSYAETAKRSENPVDSSKVAGWLTRLEVIEAMDKSDLDRKEKNEIRQEVKQIKKGLKTANGGVYISAGALIVIIILLIILL